jgi:hypothetical protein
VRAASGGGAHVPPLRAAFPAAHAAGIAAVAVLAAALLVAALARRAFREPWPGRPAAGDAG